MVTDTANRILAYIRTNKQAKVVDIVRDIGITNSAVHRQLKKLLGFGEIMKVGKPPVVFYILKNKNDLQSQQLSGEIEEFINNNYIYVSPTGEFLQGVEGFVRWVRAVNQDKFFSPLAKEYVKIRTETNIFFTPEGWVDATEVKEAATFGDKAVNKLLYQDFYSIEKFGKTKLGQMVLYAKVSQNIQIIESIVEKIKPTIDRIIKVYDIDEVAYIPPSVKRKIQLMTELHTRLKIHLPEISLVKAYAGDVIVSQKSLSKFHERVENAKHTIFVDVNKSVASPKNVLMIDDAVGSGATMHETAMKIKELIKPKGRIIGFAIVGSMKGFEVIREI